MRNDGWLPLGSCPVRFEGDTGWVETGDDGDLVASTDALLIGKRRQDLRLPGQLPRPRLPGLRQLARPDPRQRRRRLPGAHRLPRRQHRPVPEPQGQIRPGEERVHRRRAGQPAALRSPARTVAVIGHSNLHKPQMDPDKENPVPRTQRIMTTRTQLPRFVRLSSSFAALLLILTGGPARAAAASPGGAPAVKEARAHQPPPIQRPAGRQSPRLQAAGHLRHQETPSRPWRPCCRTRSWPRGRASPWRPFPIPPRMPPCAAPWASCRASCSSGVINSIGVRRDPKAVSGLVKKLKDPDPNVASAAAVALGRIGGTKAAKALTQSLSTAPVTVRTGGCRRLHSVRRTVHRPGQARRSREALRHRARRERAPAETARSHPRRHPRPAIRRPASPAGATALAGQGPVRHRPAHRPRASRPRR